MPVRLSAALVAEFVGTFALTFVGILAIHNAPADISNPNHHLGLLMVAIAHGLTLAIMVTAAMPTSGGHLNPAVSFGFLVTGKIKLPAAITQTPLGLSRIPRIPIATICRPADLSFHCLRCSVSPLREAGRCTDSVDNSSTYKHILVVFPRGTDALSGDCTA